MGLILGTSVLIADERGRFDMPGFLRQFPSPQPIILEKAVGTAEYPEDAEAEQIMKQAKLTRRVNAL